MSKGILIACIVVGIPAALAGIFVMSEGGKFTPTYENARSMCRSQIETSLNDPKSADWDGLDGWPVSVSDSRWSVDATYRAKNGYGAYVVGHQRCKLLEIDKELQITALEDI